ncbi:MAG TPA: hypothetical protein VL096_16055, partial [Pirellulaceae bacterium]|nr:hypothetical protein [Pirellulaceae bacterium]
LLVARADVANPTVKKLMKSMFESEFARRIQPMSPREILAPYRVHPGALAYLNRNQPIITEEWFELAGSALSIFGAFSAGALTLYGFVRRKRIKRPEEYLEEIRKIDLLAAGLSRDCDATIAPQMLVRQLDHRLVKLKEQLIQDYCDNRVQGEMVMMSILSMLADSRAQLHRPAPPEDAPLPPLRLEEVRKQSAKDVLRNLRPAA